MTCPRCGNAFEGNFCPRCGTPAARPAAAPVALAYRGVCPRCGTWFAGNFCPRCGLSAGAIGRPPRLSPGFGRLLTGVWTLALAGFLVLMLINFIGLVATPALILQGAQEIQRGASVDPGIDQGSASWTFLAAQDGATGAAATVGGNPDSYLQMTLPAGASAGVWYQRFVVAGSVPYAAIVDLDINVQTPSNAGFSGELVVGVDGSAGAPTSGYAYGAWYNSSTPGWTHVPELDLSDLVTEPGTYYLKVAFYAAGGAGSAVVGFDNVQLLWATNAAVVLYLPLPLPVVLVVTQDPGVFFAYFMAVFTVIILSAAYYTVRERKLLKATILAPAEAIGKRLRSMSAWVATAQAWMAALFVQVVIIYAYIALVGQEPPSPIGTPTQASAWALLFDLANASVYEELVFRALLIGVPMVLGSLLLRSARPAAPGTARPPLSHSLKYLLGGQLRQSSSREALLAGWILLFASATLFGLAHAPGWGWWKVIPALVAGLAFAYLFLRHGIAAAILAHFATDYVSAVVWIGIGGAAASVLVDYLFLGLALLGSGFFVWYVIDAWAHLRDLWSRFATPRVRMPAATGVGWNGGGVPPYAPPYTPPVQAPPPTAPAYPPPPPPTGQAYPQPAYPSPDATSAYGANRNAIPGEYRPSYRPPPYGYPPVRYQCPRCGWVEAKYDEGHFTCLRCGQTT